MMNRSWKCCWTILGLIIAFGLFPTMAFGQMRIRDFCRVKGQEENTLQGIGLVVGLKGTGDGDSAPTARALAAMLSLMRNPIANDARGEAALTELKSAKNVALVFVTASVPESGARQGDVLNCQVNAISAKSLDGGHLMLTPLLGPRPGLDKIYAFAQGPVTLDDRDRPATAKIHLGCRLEEDFFNPFLRQGKFTLVLTSAHAGFQTAQEIAEVINTTGSFYKKAQSGPGDSSGGSDIARALDAVNVEVQIPPAQCENPVEFVSQVLSQRVVNHTPNEGRVVINQRTGTIAIGADVEIGPAAVSLKNIAVQTGGQGGTPDGTFVGVDSSAQPNARLKALVERLNALRVPPADQIEIIKALERGGKIFGRVIVE